MHLAVHCEKSRAAAVPDDVVASFAVGTWERTLYAPYAVCIALPDKGQIEFEFWGRGGPLQTHVEGCCVGEDRAVDQAAELDWKAEERGGFLGGGG